MNNEPTPPATPDLPVPPTVADLPRRHNGQPPTLPADVATTPNHPLSPDPATGHPTTAHPAAPNRAEADRAEAKRAKAKRAGANWAHAGAASRAPLGGRVDDGVDETVVGLLRKQVAGRLAEHARRHQQRTGSPLPDAERAALISQLIETTLDRYTAEELAAGRPPLRPHAESLVRRRIRDDLLAAGGMQRWLDDDEVEDIVANGCDVVQIRRQDGRWCPVAAIAASDADMVELVRTLAARSGNDERRWDRADPILDVQLPDGSRLHAVMAVSRRPSLSIRRHRFPTVRLADLVAAGTLDRDLADLLTAAVRARCNIMISGRTGAGKTTMLRALAAAIDPGERIVTIEDSYELGLDHDPQAHRNVVALQTRAANTEGVGGIDMSALFRAGLRMGPDRVIVGEVRGDETIAMLNAMSQGNDGSLSTIHARSSAGVFAKLALYAMQAPQRIPPETTAMLTQESLNLVLHLAIASGNRRVVTSVREVAGWDGVHVNSNEIFRPGADGRAVAGAPMSTALADQLAAHGYQGHSGMPVCGHDWWQEGGTP